MAFFKEALAKALTRDRDNAKATRDRLVGKLSDAEAAIISAKSLAQRAALDGDDGGLDAAEAAEHTAQRRHGTIVAALAESEKLLTLIESQIATMTDQKLRVATNAAALALADELVEAGAAYDASTAALSEVSTRALAVTMEANGLAVFTASSRIEVAAAIPIVAEVLRQHGRAVLNNLAPAAMPKPAPEPAKVVPVVKEKLVTVFVTRPVRWRDADGAERRSGKYVDVDLPAATAKHALAIGAALPLDHPARRQNLGMWPGNYSLSQCLDLDAVGSNAAEKPQHDPVVHSAFQPIDRGKPFTLKIAAGGS